MSVRQLTVRSAVFSIAMLLQSGVSFILIPIYTRYLTPADYGILAVANALAVVLGVVYLQTIDGVYTRFFYDFQDADRRRDFFGALWTFHAAFAVALTLALFFIGPRLPASIMPVPFEPYGRYVVLTALVTTVGLLFPRALHLARERTWSYTALSFGHFLLSTGAVIYFVALARQGAAGSLKGMFLAAALTALGAGLTTIRNIRLRWDAPQIKAGLAFALPLTPHLLSVWVLDLADRIILKQFVPLAEVGIYTLGYQIGSIPQVLALAVSTAISPFYYRTAETDPDAGPVLSKLSTYYIAFVAWSAVATVGLGREAIAIVASGHAYDASYAVVPWIALGSFVRAFYFVFASALYFTKRLRALPWITTSAAAINIALNLLLVPRIGSIAAAMTTVVTYALQTAILSFYSRRAYPLPYQWRAIALTCLLGVSSATLLSLFHLGDPRLSLVVKAALLLLFPLILHVTRIVPLRASIER